MEFDWIYDQFVSWFEALDPTDQRLIVKALQSKESLTHSDITYLCRNDFLAQLSSIGLDWLQQAMDSPIFDQINAAIATGEFVRDDSSTSFEEEWHCVKCGFIEYETDRFAATGPGLAKQFGIQNKQFITVSCIQCGYTEIYKDYPAVTWRISY